MSKPVDVSNKEKDIPSPEDQFMLGYSDAERMENEQEGLGLSYITSSISQLFDPEYVRGFYSYLNR